MDDSVDLSLPDDLLREMLLQVSMKDAAKLLCVSKQFAKLKTDDSLWKSVIRNNYAGENFASEEDTYDAFEWSRKSIVENIIQSSENSKFVYVRKGTAGPQDDNKFDRVPNQWWKPPKLEDKRPYTSPVGWYQKMANLACRPLLVRLSFTRLDNSKGRFTLNITNVTNVEQKVSRSRGFHLAECDSLTKGGVLGYYRPDEPYDRVTSGKGKKYIGKVYRCGTGMREFSATIAPGNTLTVHTDCIIAINYKYTPPSEYRFHGRPHDPASWTVNGLITDNYIIKLDLGSTEKIVAGVWLVAKERNMLGLDMDANDLILSNAVSITLSDEKTSNQVQGAQ